jgi:hypothetical protein
MSCQFLDAEKKIAYLWLYRMEGRETFEIRKAANHANIGNELTYVYNRLVKAERPEDEDEAIEQLPSFIETLSALLKDMRKNDSTYLIVDIRKNTGGWSAVIPPMMYLLFGDDYFAKEINTEVVMNISEYYLKKFSTNIDQFNQGRNFRYETGDYLFIPNKDEGSASERREKFLQELRDDNLSYVKYLESLKGNPIHSASIIVLVSPTTGSSAYHLMFNLWHMGARIVGVPPGQAGNAFMDSTSIQLPNSGIGGGIAHSAMVLFPDDLKRGITFLPDEAMTCADFANHGSNSNAEISFALKLVRDRKIN